MKSGLVHLVNPQGHDEAGLPLSACVGAEGAVVISGHHSVLSHEGDGGHGQEEIETLSVKVTVPAEGLEPKALHRALSMVAACSRFSGTFTPNSVSDTPPTRPRAWALATSVSEVSVKGEVAGA